MACVSLPVLTTAAEGVGVGALSGLFGGAKSGNSLKDALMGGVLGGLGGEAVGAYGASGASTAGDSLAADNGIDQGVSQSVDASGDSVPMNSPDATSFGTPTASGALSLTPQMLLKPAFLEVLAYPLFHRLCPNRKST